MEHNSTPNDSSSSIVLFEANISMAVHILEAVDKTKSFPSILAEFVTTQIADEFVEQ